MSRPSKYEESFVRIAAGAASLGATDREVADMLGVCERTLNYWKLEHPDFNEALKVGKDAADNRVEQSLYRKAVGYSFDSEKVFQYEGQIVRAPITEHVPPSDTAAIFWLKNRRKDEWRDKQEVEHNVGAGLAELIASRRAAVAKLNERNDG